MKNEQLVLVKRPITDFNDDLFELRESDSKFGDLPPNNVVVRSLMFSCDPTQRIWASDQPQYMPPVRLNDPMRALVAGVVVQSNSKHVRVGDHVTVLGHWSKLFVVPASNCSVVPSGVRLEQALACSLTLETAYVGLVFVGKVRPGDTVLVTGAAGATGSGVVQIGKIGGCKVIGVAGGSAKCAKVCAGPNGADHCLDYKQLSPSQLSRELHKLAPNGIDVFFDNVGGPLLDVGLANLAMGARVVVCGAVSQYNKSRKEIEGPKNYLQLLMRRATMTGFIFSDHADQVREAKHRLAQWIRSNQLHFEIDLVEAPLSSAPAVVRRLFKGENQGKQIHKLSDPASVRTAKL